MFTLASVVEDGLGRMSRGRDMRETAAIIIQVRLTKQ